MGFINAYLNKTAKLYDIDRSTSTATGQPVETLVFLKNIKVFFSSNPRKVFTLLDAGQVQTGNFVAISATATQTFQVLEVDSVKYRINAANPVQMKTRIFAYINYLEYYKH